MKQTLHVTVGSWVRVAGRETGPRATAVLGDVGEQRAGGNLCAHHARTCSRRPLAQAPLRRARAQVVPNARSSMAVAAAAGVHVAALAEGGLTSIPPQGRWVRDHPNCGMSKCTAAFGACQASGAS